MWHWVALADLSIFVHRGLGKQQLSLSCLLALYRPTSPHSTFPLFTINVPLLTHNYVTSSIDSGFAEQHRSQSRRIFCLSWMEEDARSSTSAPVCHRWGFFFQNGRFQSTHVVLSHKTTGISFFQHLNFKFVKFSNHSFCPPNNQKPKFFRL